MTSTPEIKPQRPLFNNWEYAAIVVIALAQVALVGLVLPTLFTDTAEAMLWGRLQPMLSSHKHPPLMGYAGYVLGLFGAPAAWKAYLCQLLLNAAAIAYTNGVARKLMPDVRRQAIIFGLCLTVVMGVWSAAGYSLNADMIAIPFWIGAVYHAMSAKDRPSAWWHWVGLGVCLALAMLAKYFAVLLAFSLLVGSLVLPSYRALWRRPQILISIVISLALLGPHLWAMAQQPETISYAGNQFVPRNLPYGLRVVVSSLRYVLSYIIMGLPALGLLSLAVWLGHRKLKLDLSALQQTEDRVFVGTVFGAITLCAVIAILFGIDYRGRFNAPIYPIFVLLWFVMMPLEVWLGRRWIRRLMHASLVIWVVAIAATAVAYSRFTTHHLMQEPLPQLAEGLRTEWAQRYGCGPAYIIGDWRPAPTAAVYYSPSMIGIPEIDLDRTPWFDAGRAKRQGVIFLTLAPPSIEWNKAFSLYEPVKSVTLTTLHSTVTRDITYYYQIQPPQSCP